MLMLRMLQRMGYTVRWVVDWADHVGITVSLVCPTKSTIPTSYLAMQLTEVILYLGLGRGVRTPVAEVGARGSL